MYKTDFICTYKMMVCDEDDESYIQDALYQTQFLQAFGLFDYDAECINNSLNYIYDKIKNEEEFKEIIQKHPYYKNDMEEVLMYLFAYNTFDLFHQCLVDFFESGSIKKENKDKLLLELLSLENSK